MKGGDFMSINLLTSITINILTIFILLLIFLVIKHFLNK